MTALPTNDEQRLGELGPNVVRTAGIVGIAGLAVSVALGFMLEDGDRFYRSYLTAFIFVLTIALGGLFFTLINHATRTGWAVVLRRLTEAVAANLSWLWILFIPVLISLWKTDQYHWAHPGDDPILLHKSPYLNVGFWLVRAAFFFLLWGFLGLFYFRNSVNQDADGNVSFTHRMQRLAPAAIILYALSQTFASVDWVKSLEAHWFSTMFGVCFFAASTCGFFASLILIVFYLQKKGKLATVITLEHYQDMGKLLFAFGVVFWAYIAFSQFMLIWYANLPEETTWYMARQLGGWKAVSYILLAGHFVIPFLLLVTKHTKRVKPVLAAIAFFMLAMHYVDVYWLTMPKVPAEQIAAAESLEELEAAIGTPAAVRADISGFVQVLTDESGTRTIRVTAEDGAADDQMVPEGQPLLVGTGEFVGIGDLLTEAPALAGADIGYAPHLIDLTCLIGLGGLFVAGTAHRLRRCALYPVRDPRLSESLAFENM